MKRLLTTVLIAFALLSPAVLVSGHSAAANVFQACNDPAAQSADVCNDAQNSNGNPIIKIIKTAIQILSFLIGIAAVIGIVVSGVRIITAGGNSESVASARSALIYSLVGLALAFLAQAIVAFVLDNVK
jgi:hypothetical protein